MRDPRYQPDHQGRLVPPHPPPTALHHRARRVASVLLAAAALTTSARAVSNPPPGAEAPVAAPPSAPPDGAVVLFDGADTGALVMANDGRPCRWPIRDATLVVDRAAGDVLSTRAFGDCLLHLEWWAPAVLADDASAQPANSGVKLQQRYEVQILGTPGPPAPPDIRGCGSIYGHRAPDRNASTGPATWQTYDVWFTAPRWEDGRKVSPARMTVVWNGVLVHDDVVVPAKTGASAAEAPGDHPLLLQAHASDAVEEVRFRNVWVLPQPRAAGRPPPTAGDAPNPAAPPPSPAA